jgi:hypothetical protein
MILVSSYGNSTFEALLLEMSKQNSSMLQNALHDYALDRFNERGKIPSRKLVSF